MRVTLKTNELIRRAEEAELLGAWEILNAEYDNGTIIIEDVDWAIDQVSDFMSYIAEAIDEPPMYYVELINRNSYLADDRYAGLYVLGLLLLIQKCAGRMR